MTATILAFMAGLERRQILARGVRDGAHEAFHAIACKGFVSVRHREVLHRRLAHEFKGQAFWEHELQARAVERIVCARVGKTMQHSLAEWVTTSIAEAAEFDLPHGHFEASLAYASAFQDSKMGKAAADLVLAWVLKR